MTIHNNTYTSFGSLSRIVMLGCLVFAAMCQSCVKKSDFDSGIDSDGSGNGTEDAVQISGTLASTRGEAYDSLPSLKDLTMWYVDGDSDEMKFSCQIVDGGKALKPSRVLYWDNLGESVTFFSCYPEVDNDKVAYDKDLFTVVQPENVVDQFDFMLADKATANNGEVVTLTYRHKMSQIMFSATYDSETSHDVCVEKIRFNGLFDSVTFKWNGSEWVATQGQTTKDCVASKGEELKDVDIVKFEKVTDGELYKLFTQLSSQVALIVPQTLGDMEITYVVDNGTEQTKTFDLSSIKATTNSQIMLYIIIDIDAAGVQADANDVIDQAWFPDQI